MIQTTGRIRNGSSNTRRQQNLYNEHGIMTTFGNALKTASVAKDEYNETFESYFEQNKCSMMSSTIGDK